MDLKSIKLSELSDIRKDLKQKDRLEIITKDEKELLKKVIVEYNARTKFW